MPGLGFPQVSISAQNVKIGSAVPGAFLALTAELLPLFYRRIVGSMEYGTVVDGVFVWRKMGACLWGRTFAIWVVSGMRTVPTACETLITHNGGLNG